MITAEEKLAKLREKQAQLKAQEKKIIAQENAKARKARTKRLIEIGAAAESILGRPFQDHVFFQCLYQKINIALFF